MTVPGQAPGAFSIYVSDSRGNRLSWENAIEISTPAEAVRTIQIEVITVTGRLYLGKEPLSATVWFGGQFGSQQ